MKVASIHGVNMRSWSASNFCASFYKARGYIDVHEPSCLKRIKELGLLFGFVPRKKGFQYFGAQMVAGVDVWWPRIGNENPKSPWRNEVVEWAKDGTVATIEEKHIKDASKNTQHVKICIQQKPTRLVFMNYNGDIYPVGIGYGYRLAGLFRLDTKESILRNVCVWRRVKIDRLSIPLKQNMLAGVGIGND